MVRYQTHPLDSLVYCDVVRCCNASTKSEKKFHGSRNLQGKIKFFAVHNFLVATSLRLFSIEKSNALNPV